MHSISKLLFANAYLRLVVFSLLAFLLLVCTTSNSQTRNWVDNTGQFSIEAECIGVVEGKVILVKSNGMKIKVPLSRLSSADKAIALSYSKNIPNDFEAGNDLAKDFEKYSKLIKHINISVRDSSTALQFIQSFINSKNIDDNEVTLAKEKLVIWQDRANKNCFRHGKDWITSEDLANIKKNEIRLLQEAHRLIEVGNDRLSLEKFLDASKANSEGIRSDFYLGLLYALSAQKPLLSVKHFKECIKRLEVSPDRLIGTRKANYVASLNNLAVAQVRTKKYDHAIRNWTKAIEISPRTPELVQNLGRLTELGGTGSASRISSRVGDKAGELYARATVANNSAQFDSNVGWLFIPLIDSLDGSMSASGDNELQTVAWATGIAVDQDIILTTTHVTAGAQRFSIAKPGVGYGKIVALNPDTNLVLIRFDGLNAKPIAWSTKIPAPATDLHLVGHTQPGFGANGLRSSATTVVNSRDYDPIDLKLELTQIDVNEDGSTQLISLSTNTTVGSKRTLLNHNKILNAGYIGSPLCDKRGRAYGVHLGSRANQATAQSFSLAETSSSILEFISSAIPDFDFDTSSPENGEISEPLGGVTPRLENTIFQISGLQFAPRLQWSHKIAQLHKSGDSNGWTSFEDRSCFLCNGTGHTTCTNRYCKNGRIKSYETRTDTAPSGETVTRRIPVYNSCPTCGGSGQIRCQSCNGKGKF